MPKQEFEVIDYFGALIVAIIFSIILFLISFFILNFFCIHKYDDFTKFELWGAKRNMRLGVHSLKLIKKGGFLTEEELMEEDD
ncbi:hypothetical protein WR25_10565 [Diploscapter pachys]|uniref:Uncharacterized protein n=1 Tax=Diploscapter pachys TaxID=2018661 RepID=A0A2A2JTT4_9BILA|nr:hypothetical protein WR25_10565 [Diploscapter pachys]